MLPRKPKAGLMHFRHVDDEILFGRLKAQLIESLRGAPTHMLTNVLRVLGRIESVAFYEGVRQGVVAHVIDRATSVSEDDPSPIAVHARVYNAAFTPLAAAEERYVRRQGIEDVAHVIFAALAATPLEMPPMTLAEALASPTSSFAAPAPPVPAVDMPHVDDPIPPWLAGLLGDDATNGIIEGTVVRTDGSSTTSGFTEQPHFIERCRDVLQTRMRTGWGPAGWTDLVFAIRDDLHADPFAIDLNLSSDVGKNMLRSIGLFEIADAILDQAAIDAMLRAPTQQGGVQ